jgi:predicted esterase
MATPNAAAPARGSVASNGAAVVSIGSFVTAVSYSWARCMIFAGAHDAARRARVGTWLKEKYHSERVGSFPTNPVAVVKNTKIRYDTAQSEYYTIIPNSYDATHGTPATLFVWLHGRGGKAFWDIDHITPGGTQSWIGIAVGGREGMVKGVNQGVSWQQGDEPKVLEAIADMRTKYNIHPKKIILGGYSSGGDLGYLVAFRNSTMFAGVLFENTDPFLINWPYPNDADDYFATAPHKFKARHLHHTEDTTYPTAAVTTSMNRLATAGYDVQLIQRPGTHWNDDTPSSGTWYDYRALLFPFLDAGWMAP